MNVRVKICGITRLEDASAAVEAGADALGFMFYEPSPRYIRPPDAARIIAQLPPFIAKVGVFVDATENFIRDAINACRLDSIQLHGNESPAFCGCFNLPVIKAFRIKDAESLRPLPQFQTSAWLLDSYTPGVPGGTGERFNWDLAVKAKALGKPIILAGGLTPGNVRDAVQQVQPYAVDVSSGVESSAPGKKDHLKLRQFIAAARGFDPAP